MGQNLVDNGLRGPTSFVTIPENLRIVITKMMPEITRMGVARVEAFKKYNPVNFDVIDEYIIGIIPTILGKGRPLFLENNPTINLYLIESTISEGIVISRYVKR